MENPPPARALRTTSSLSRVDRGVDIVDIGPWFTSGMQAINPPTASPRNDTDYAGRGRHQLVVIPPPVGVADNGNYFDWWWQAVAQSSPPKGPAHVNAFILIDVTRRLTEREKAGAPPLSIAIR